MEPCVQISTSARRALPTVAYFQHARTPQEVMNVAAFWDTSVSITSVLMSMSVWLELLRVAACHRVATLQEVICVPAIQATLETASHAQTLTSA